MILQAFHPLPSKVTPSLSWVGTPAGAAAPAGYGEWSKAPVGVAGAGATTP